MRMNAIAQGGGFARLAEPDLDLLECLARKATGEGVGMCLG